MTKFAPLATLMLLSVMIQASARAGIIEVGPFVGDLTETWESFPTTIEGEPYLLDPSPIMGGAATISNEFMFVYEPGVSDVSLGTSGVAQVSDGIKGMCSREAGVTTTIMFNDPIAAFGAYWAAVTETGTQIGDPANILVRFYSETNTLLGTRIINYSRPADGVLEWHGWISDEPVKYITYFEDGVAVDGLQAILVPEPTTSMVFLVIAFWVKTHRTRRQTQ